MRLQKYIAAAGVCSPTRGGEYIRQGRVTVNGVTASLGSGAEEGDVVLLNGKRLSLPEEHTYVLLHKPRGYVTTLRDTHGRPTVAELVQDAGVRLFPVGRLDCMSEGLLLFTDDGEMANRLAHPSHGVSKTYRVWVSGPDAAEAAGALRRPIVYEGAVPRSGGARSSLHGGSGAYRCHDPRGKTARCETCAPPRGSKGAAASPHPAGEISLGDLPAGQWRYLTAKELEYLQSLR